MLLAPTRPDQASAVTVDFLRDVYAALRSMFDYVIVDTPPGFTPEVIASIDSSSDVCMVGMLDSLSLKNTKLGLETLDLMGYDRRRTSRSSSTARDSARRDHARRRRRRHRPRARRVRPERPRDPALGQRRHADRDLTRSGPRRRRRSASSRERYVARARAAGTAAGEQPTTGGSKRRFGGRS